MVALTQNGIVLGLIEQPDGKLLVTTGFDEGWNPSITILSRLEADGSPDTLFHPQLDLPQGTYQTPSAVAVDAKNRILVGLSFATNNYPTSTLLRLNPDGSRDSNFSPPFNVLAGSVTAIAVQSDGQILVGSGGAANSPVQPAPGTVLARLNANGDIDKSFTSPFTNRSAIAQLTILSNQQILVAGGLLPATNALGGSLYRLNPDGSLDLSFQPEKQPASPYSGMSPIFFLGQADDVLFVANGESVSRDCFGLSPVPLVVRLDSQGKIVQAIAKDTITFFNQLFWLEPNGSMIIGDGTRLARVLPDGTTDPAFGSEPFFAGGYIRSVRQIVQQADGAYVVAGHFVKTPGQIPLNLIRLRPTDQPVPPLITAAKAGGGGLVLSVFTGGAGIYSLVGSTDLPSCNQAGWLVITNLTGGSDQVQVPIADAQHPSYKFFRVGLP
jgi:uncharacterized delta-60 repeat protein